MKTPGAISVLALLAAFLLSGCAVPPDNVVYPANRDPQSARRICDVDSLATMRSSLLQQSNELKRSGGAIGGIGGNENGVVGGAIGVRSGARNSTSNETSVTDSALMAKMRAFEAEVDAQYRAVTSACRAFVECMEHNFYDETRCRSLQRRWESSEDKFSSLTISLREIASWARSRKARASVCCDEPKYPPPPDRCTEDCSQIGTVFTDCCARKRYGQ